MLELALVVVLILIVFAASRVDTTPADDLDWDDPDSLEERAHRSW